MAERNRKYFREDSFFNIPKSGDIFPLKFICTEFSKYGANLSAENYVTEGSRFIRTSDIDDNGKLSAEGVYIDEQLVEEYKLKEGDFLISRSGTLGRGYLYSVKDGLCSYAGYLVKYSLNKNIANPKFIFYCTKTKQFNGWLDYSVIEATIGNINGEKYANLPLPLPSLTQQDKIVDYLDQEIAKIDALIEKKNQLINILEQKKKAVINQTVTKGLDLNGSMKNSEIEWLGEIPKHWEVVKLKYFIDINYGLSQPPEYLDNGTPLIRATNVFRGKISEKDMVYIDAEQLDSNKKITLKKGDIIIVRSGAYTADSAIITEEYENSIAGFDMVIRAKDLLFNKYLSYVLLSDYMLNKQLIPMRVRAAQPHLNAEEVGSTALVLPPLEEQATIVKYLEMFLQHNEKSISLINSSIELLKEKRTAVISAAINGELNASLS
ncbi:MAG TPA: restriction endonuclease subunit S [Flavobacterium sp.]|nr:restriction endonuclease subunit S [Flavobacterium sp.]